MPRHRRPPWFALYRGTYHAFEYDPGARQTRRLSLGTTDPGEAGARFGALLIEGQGSILGCFGVERPGAPARSNGLTVAAALDDYWLEHGSRAVDAARIDDAIANLKSYFGDQTVAALDIPACRAYAEARRQGRVGVRARGGVKPVADGTIRRELGTLTAAVNHEVRWKRLDRNDAPFIEKPRGARPRELWLFPDELVRLRAVARGRALAFIEIAYFTAARKASIERLTIFQVDLAAARINLSPAGDVETCKRRPIVPIDPALRPTIERLVAEAKAAGTPYLLGAPTDVRKCVLAAARAAGVLELSARDMRPAGTFSPHVLRHTRATHLLQAGADPWAVANLLGDSLQTVVRTYGHACPSYLAGALSKEIER